MLLLPGIGRADGDGNVVARIMEKKIEGAVAKAGPSIACVLVSRSNAYAKASYWGVPHRPRIPGQLGKFDAAAAEKRVPADARHRDRILRQITDHDLSDPKTVPESFGSGMVIDRSGFILTNAHVVHNATKIYVRLAKDHLGKERASWADIQGCDPYSDLAVLKLLDPPGDLKALPLGDGAKVKVGQLILTLTNEWAPRLPGLTARAGYVRAVRQKPPMKPSEMKLRPDERESHRRKLTIHHNGTLILIDADGAPGCSGAAVLDLDGKVIGLTSALAGIGSERVGYVIPFDTNTRRITDVLKKGEEVEYGFLGVTLGTAANRMPRSVFLNEVIQGMPAERTGLRQGDRIISINGHEMKKPEDLFLHIAMGLAGTTVKIEVERRGATLTFFPRLAKFDVHKQAIASKQPPARFGLRVDYTSILSQRPIFFPRWSQRKIPAGVIVREVVPDGPADRARLQPDKVITAVNGKPVTTPAEFYEKIAQAGDTVELTYLNSERQHVRLTLHNK
jgi:serine protease Do